jgi:hypothetical protein
MLYADDVPDSLARWEGDLRLGIRAFAALPGCGRALIEAVMVRQSANAGVSFTSVGRVITNEPL